MTALNSDEDSLFAGQVHDLLDKASDALARSRPHFGRGRR